MTKQAYLIGAARTAIGTFGGAFAQTPATVLGSAAIKGVLERSAIAAADLDEIIFGNVLSAGLGQNPARQAAMGAGVPANIGATTISKVCGSGLKAVMLAVQAIACNDASAVIAGGMENMSRSPYLLEKARSGYRLGNGELVDSMIKDGLWCAAGDVGMGPLGDRCAARYGFSRKQQDDYAVASYQRALAAGQAGIFAGEILPVETMVAKKKIVIDQDEGPARFNEAKLRQLGAAFDPAGTVTAGNASGINDGAAAVAVVSGDFVSSHHLNPQAKILGYATASREPEWFTLAPIDAIQKLMARLKLNVADVDLFEINEAFSCVPMAAMQDLQLPHDKVNVHGGSVALGHPIGASGARTLVTLVHALRRRQARIGITCLCIGGGEAVAMAIEHCA